MAIFLERLSNIVKNCTLFIIYQVGWTDEEEDKKTGKQ